MSVTTCVHVWVIPDKNDEFINATIENHNLSKLESGNIRFDVCQDLSDANKFMIYEAYINEQAAAAHKATAHYQKWRDTVAPFMAQPRQGIKFNILAH